MRILTSLTAATVCGGIVFTIGCQAPEENLLGEPTNTTQQAIDGTGETEPPKDTVTDSERARCSAWDSTLPYLKCNLDQGSEFLPEICREQWRTCTGYHERRTVCVSPIRGSEAHVFLQAVCEASRPDAADESPIPKDFDAIGFMSNADPKSTVVYDDPPIGELNP